MRFFKTFDSSFSAWERTALLVALAQVLLSFGGLWVERGTGEPARAISDGVFLALVFVFGVAAIFLFVGGRQDRRAQYLAASYLVTASAFALLPLTNFARAVPHYELILRGLTAVHVEALLPFFVWCFARHFPRVIQFGWPARIARSATAVSLSVGTGLIAANFAFFLAGNATPNWSPSGGFAWLTPEGALYWPSLLALLAAALLFAAWKTRRASIDERRRVALLMVGLGIGLAPVLIVNGLDYTVPAFHRFVNRPSGLRTAGLFAYPAIFVGPLITVYAVLVRKALEVRLVVRKAIQYALARHSIGTLAAFPFVALAIVLYLNRHQTLAQILTGSKALQLSVAAVLGVGGMVVRGRVVRSIDRLFFREQYDSKQILTDLVEKNRDAATGQELGAQLVTEIERALHPQAVSVLIADHARAALVPTSTGVRPLGLGTGLTRILTDAASPLEIDWERPDSLVHSMPKQDSYWLADNGFQLLVPLLSGGGELTGLVGLGEKRSELPYSREDKELLGAIAASASLTIENRILRGDVSVARQDTSHPASSLEQLAHECRDCGALTDQVVGACTECGGPMVMASFPLVLPGKYHFTQRIGRGGMGIVYRAVDLRLGRDVAVKTLPKMSPRSAHRLRREARAVASLSHPNLALIFAAESWHGTPFLIFEYLRGGTLADRLADAPLAIGEALDLGIVLADVAACIHDAGILHRDIKPSNIGFTKNGVPKLLDFGLARILEVTRELEVTRQAGGDAVRGSLVKEAVSAEMLGSESLATITRAGETVGTLLYMSPEMLKEEPPAPSFDLWSICILLYEAIAGQSPVAEKAYYLTLLRIVESDIPDLREYVPEAPPDVADFFKGALSVDPRRRPSSGAELLRRLNRLQSDAS